MWMPPWTSDSGEFPRPQEVVPQNRIRALSIWMILIGAILSYSAWVVYSGFEQRRNPSTSFTISNDIYLYPDLWVCLYDTYGCDDRAIEEQCVDSIFDTEGGFTTARYRPGDDDETLIIFTENLTEERGWCVIFEASDLVYNLGSDRDPDDYIDYTRLDMYWYPGGSANNSTTCIQETGAWTSHSENIYAFLNDPVTDEVSAGIQIPYSCMTNESSSHHFTYVGIGVTEEYNIHGEETASYNALTIATVEHKDEESEVLIRLFEDHKLVAVVDVSSRVGKFLQSEFGARYLRAGAPEHALKKLLPSKTYIVEVPANIPATSVATSIAGHCKAGGDADQARSAPISVKVMRVSCSVCQSQALAASPYVAANDNRVEESVVDLGEGLVGRVFTPPHKSGEVSQREARVCLQIPKEMHQPLRRSLSANHVNSSKHKVPSRAVPPNETASLEEA